MSVTEDTYTDNRDIDTIVNSTTADPKYEHIVTDILRDKRHDWSLNYYNDKKTSWDIEIVKAKNILKDCQDLISLNNAILDKQTKDLAKYRLGKTHPDYLHLTTQNLKTMDSAYAVATDTITESRDRINTTTAFLNEALWNQYIESRTTRIMRHLRTKFKADDNIEFLRRGVTWIHNYAVKLHKYNTLNTVTYKEINLEANSAW